MNSLNKHIKMAIALGVLSLLALVFSHLALTDIAHGEGNLTMEWATLRAAALIFLMFIALTLITLSRVLKYLK